MWQSAAEHGKYRAERVERLALRAQIEADIAALAGDIVQLEPGWTSDGGLRRGVLMCGNGVTCAV